jgi:hypothetical protein
MTRYAKIAPIVLALLSPLACNNASDDQAKANKAQSEANGDINANNKRAAREDLAAQAAANRTVTAANADFAKLRDDYGSKTTKNLGDLDRKVGVLETKSTAGKTKAQLDVDERLAQIHAKRVQFDADLKTSQSAAEGNWDFQKAHLDQEFAELQALVDKSMPAEMSAKSN